MRGCDNGKLAIFDIDRLVEKIDRICPTRRRRFDGRMVLEFDVVVHSQVKPLDDPVTEAGRPDGNAQRLLLGRYFIQ